MRVRWKKTARRAAALVLACAACFAALAVPAFAETGQVWLNWVTEPGGYGAHAGWYSHFEQAQSEVTASANESCANGWYGAPGRWVFGSDACEPGGYGAATPALGDPGVGAYPWAQTAERAALWGWAGYCGC